MTRPPKESRIGRTTPPGKTPEAGVPPRGGFWIVTLCAALALRIGMLTLAPAHGYLSDHDDMVRWGIQAADHGLLTLYDTPAPRHDLLRLQDGRWVRTQRQVDRRFVYPPLMAYPVWAAGELHRALSPDRTANTVMSRAVFAAVSIASEVLVAFGAAALAATLAGPLAGRWAFALTLFAPPLWLDSTWWGQVDPVVLAPLVWMVWAMCRSRWLAAGALFGAATMLKPQAIVLGPVWLVAMATTRPRWKPALGLLAAAGTALLVSLPFTLHGGASWWRTSYVTNLTTEFPATTLKAFNFWYADALIHESVDVHRRWLGLTMDTWGRVLMGLALAAGLAAVVRRWGSRPRGLVIAAALTALLTVMLGTRVHDRYLLLALPFLVVASTWRRGYAVALAALLVVATAQLTWTRWLRTEPGGAEAMAAAARLRYPQALADLPPAQRSQAPTLEQYLAGVEERYRAGRARTAPVEWLLVLLALGGTAAFAGSALVTDPAGNVEGPRGPRGPSRRPDAGRAR